MSRVWVVAALAGLAACARGTGALDVQSRDSVAAALVPGVTTPAQIRQAYGAPAHESSANGTTVWEYGLRSERPNATNFIPLVNLLDSGGTLTGKVLVVAFANDRLTTYFYRAQQSSTHSGIGQ